MFVTFFSEICFIRLDFETFELTQPDTTAATGGSCTADYLTFSGAVSTHIAT